MSRRSLLIVRTAVCVLTVLFVYWCGHWASAADGPPSKKSKSGNDAAASASDQTAPGYGRWGQGRGRRWRGGRGAGQGRGGPWRGGRGPDAQFEADRALFHFLLDNRESIRRKVTKQKNGVETLTESDAPKVAKQLQTHVASMVKRIEQGQPIRMRDPLFAEIFRNADKIDMKVENTDAGVRVVETSDDPYVAKLIQAHAKVVSRFIKNGYPEAQANHKAPKR